MNMSPYLQFYYGHSIFSLKFKVEKIPFWKKVRKNENKILKLPYLFFSFYFSGFHYQKDRKTIICFRRPKTTLKYEIL